MSKVSIILPVYNGEKFLKESIESVIKQTFTDWELIIVNDCSTDSSLSIVEEYIKKDSRIKIINNKENKKLPESLNIGFREAKGEYYTWTSDDNKYYPTAIEKMVEILDNNKNYGMVYAVSKTVNVDNNIVGKWGDIEITPLKILDSNIIGACFLYRNEIAKQVGEYDKSTFLAEDHDYWIRLYKTTKIAHLTDELYFYRHHKNNLTAKRSKDARLISRKLAVQNYKEYEKLFPEYANLIEKRWSLVEALLNEDNVSYENLKKELKNKYIYNELKSLYKLNNSKWLINKIRDLGGKYIIMSFLLSRRKK